MDNKNREQMHLLGSLNGWRSHHSGGATVMLRDGYLLLPDVVQKWCVCRSLSKAMGKDEEYLVRQAGKESPHLRRLWKPSCCFTVLSTKEVY